VDEIRNIYEHVSVNDDPEKMAESIASLIDPLNNSICEKCAAIKKAFLLKVNDNVARNYYVTGIQGGEKGIALDRNLVEWECEL
jgi:preprotein translocase subunit Sec63